MVVGLSLLMWRYATKGRRLIDKDISRSTISYFYIRGTATLGLFTLAFPLAIYKAHWAQVCLLIVFPMQLLLKSYHKRLSIALKINKLIKFAKKASEMSNFSGLSHC